MKRALLITVGMVLAVGMLVGGSWIWQGSLRRDATFFTDGDSIKAPASSAPVRDVLWNPARPLARPINSGDDEYEPRISADGQTLFVVRGRAGENADIYTSARTLDGWTDPVPIAALSTYADELGPQPTRDGKTLYYYSDRVGGLGGFDVWRISQEEEGGWGEPENLGPSVNTPFNDYGPALSPDGRTLYFASNQPRDFEPSLDGKSNWPATLREQFLQRSYDLFSSEIRDDGFGVAVPLDGLNTESNEGAPAISPVGDFIYFASDRPGGLGGFDLYRARMSSGEVGQTEHLGRSVNSEFSELDPALGMGGFELLFSSNRPHPGLLVEAPANGEDLPPDYNIYRTTSREVFREVDEARAAIGWMGLWSTLWPLLLLLFLLLVLLLLLRRLWAHERARLAYHRLSLLARCLLVSVLIHMLLASLLTVWSVSNQIGEFLRESSGTKVALISRSGDSIAMQIQGQITDVEIEARRPESLSRVAMNQLSELLPAAATVNVPRTEVEDSESQTETSVDDAALPEPQVEELQNEAPDSDESASVETPESATPTSVAEAQMQTLASEAGEVQAKPAAATSDARDPHVATTTTAATVLDDAASALARSDDAAAERSFTPDPSLTTPDLNASPSRTATPNDAREMVAQESRVSVPRAETAPVQRSAIEVNPSHDAAAIVNPESVRLAIEPIGETLASVNPATVESHVSLQATGLESAPIEVSAARPGQLAGPTDANQAGGEEPTLTAHANTVEARRAAATDETRSDVRGGTAVLTTAPIQTDGGAESTLARLDPALESASRSVPLDDRTGEQTTLEIAAAAAGAVASPADSSQASGDEAVLRTSEADSEARRTAVVGVSPGAATAVLDTAQSRAAPEAESTMARLRPAALESTVHSIPLDDRARDEIPLEIAAAATGEVASPTDSTQASGTEAVLLANEDLAEARRTAVVGAASGAETAILETTQSQTKPEVESTMASLGAAALESAEGSFPLDDLSGSPLLLEIAAATPGEIASPTETLVSRATEATVSPRDAVGAFSDRNTKSLDVETNPGGGGSVVIDPGAVRTIDDSLVSDVLANDARMTAADSPAFVQPKGVDLPDVPAFSALGGVSIPMMDTQPTAIDTPASATDSIASGSPTLKPLDLPDETSMALAVPLASIDVTPAVETVDISGLTPMALPELFTPGALAQDVLSSDVMPELDLGLDALALAVPSELAPRPNAFPQRAPEARRDLLEQMGGSEETENAVALALEWLARNQSGDGRWSGRDFPHVEEQGGKATFEFDSALTGLALMAFLGADHTHLNDGPYREVVADGIDWLLEHQQDDGDLRNGETMYSQGIATIALAEAYAMTGDPVLVEPVRKAIAFIEGARNEETGGWRYEPGQAGDTSVMGWQVMAMISARRAGIEVRDESINGARDWLDRVAMRSDPGLYSYQPGGEPTMSMTAESMFIWRLLGMPRNAPRMHQSAGFVVDHLPNWEEDANTYGWYYATLALYQHGGEKWEVWNATIMPELLAYQQTRGHRLGSWDPSDKWSVIGGRVYQTAICALTLEVYYRYLPTFVGDADKAAGLIKGFVVDDLTGLPIPNASVRLDVPDAEPLIALAGPDGVFEIYAPRLPTHVAVSASSPGYIPSSVNMPASEIANLVLDHEFRLSPVRPDVIAIENNPDVHHLGNDDFSGSINSQFQNSSEGLTFERVFELTESQVPPQVYRAEIRLLHKGTQANNPISINGHRLDRALTGAPRDGSFAEFVIRFPARWLQEGENRVRIRSVRGNSDLDDFEFVNVRIHLTQTDPSR